MKIRLNSLLIDKAGISASVICAIHCAIVPMLITFLPLWGLGFLADDKVEVFMICLSLGMAMFALSSAFRQHGKILPAIILVMGFMLIGAGHFIECTEQVFVPLGGITIAAAHFVNIRMTKSCSHRLHQPQKD